MRPLPPTLRLNRRYVLVQIIPNPDKDIPDQKEMYLSCAASVQSLFGDCGLAEIRPAVVWAEGEYAIIRCTRGTETKLIAALSCIIKSGSHSDGIMRVKSIITSGTIKGAMKKIIPKPRTI